MLAEDLLECSKEEFVEHYLTVKEHLSGILSGERFSYNREIESKFKVQEIEKLETLFSARFSEDILKYL